MSQVTTWKCDRCKKTWSSDKDKNPLTEVSVVTMRYGGRGEVPLSEWQAQWCENCRKATGVFRPANIEREQPSLPEPLTLEEIIREIVQKEIQAS